VPLARRLLAPLAAVAVVVVVIVLLIAINGHDPHPKSNSGPVAPATTPTSGLTPSTPSTSPTPRTSKPPAPKKTHKPTPKPRPKRTRKPTSHVPTAMADVEVLNNSRRTGLAHAVASEVEAKGWHVAFVGNLQGRVAQTTVYYAPGDEAAAQHLAGEFGSIQRVEPDSEGGIHVSGLTLVLTQSWAD
jgi:LytR cell envelope-related transcriptional attenuator